MDIEARSKGETGPQVLWTWQKRVRDGMMASRRLSIQISVYKEGLGGFPQVTLSKVWRHCELS